MSDILTEITFWHMVVKSLGRTIVCSPENESRIKGYIDARALRGFYKVVVNPVCRDTQIFVIDEEAIQAETNRALGSWRLA